jgi:alkylhydroperoxidase family enzyme
VRSLYARAREVDDAPRSEAIASFQAIIDECADLPGPERSIARFAVAHALTPGRTTEGDLLPLRAAGLGDRAIHDVVQVVCCFAYMNRLADGLGVTLLPHQYDLARELFGAEALEAHLRWGERGVAYGR